MSDALAGSAGQPAGALDLTIAGVQLAFRAASGLTLAPPAFEYPAFLGSRGARQRVPVSVACAPPPAPPAGARLAFDTDDGWQLFEHADRRWLRMPIRDAGAPDGAVLWQVEWREPLGEARLLASPDSVVDGEVRHVIQYPLDQILITRALLAGGGLLLHAAGAVAGGEGLAFAGVSGAGKSTITRLLRDAGPFTFLSDDRVVACPGGVGYDLHGTPWAGDARVARACAAPLRALCFLSQAAAPALRALPRSEALERLLAVTTLPWFDGARIGRALDAAGDLVARIPCFELAFTRNARDTGALLERLPRAA